MFINVKHICKGVFVYKFQQGKILILCFLSKIIIALHISDMFFFSNNILIISLSVG